MVSCVVTPDWIRGRVAMNAPALPPESVHKTVQVHSQLALPLTALSKPVFGPLTANHNQGPLPLSKQHLFDAQMIPHDQMLLPTP
ncbi:hypothetical protein DY000_02007635 [Brassica cretica]|uniref:Uncharacterized protein n=1 Tax=Brassica cretica TaxID=69181 RepID=A0ABQ7CM87_BRACR|nr:hypothetical protein DY000_02007635 [Brassica cretica]